MQAEFEEEREGLLATIRRHERSLKFFEAVLDRVVPCLRRECNYSNIDKIRTQAEYDEETETWLMPTLTNGRSSTSTSTSSQPQGDLATAPAPTSPMAPRPPTSASRGSRTLRSPDPDQARLRDRMADSSDYFNMSRSRDLRTLLSDRPAQIQQQQASRLARFDPAPPGANTAILKTLGGTALVPSSSSFFFFSFFFFSPLFFPLFLF